MQPSRAAVLALAAFVVLLPLLLHHNAWRGWFEDDDLDTLTWATKIPAWDLIRNIPSLRYPPEHARPTGYFFYDAIGRRWGLDYFPYIAILQAICALNVALVWLLLRRIGIGATAAAAGCIFFACHRALFDAWWKPMFVYDVLCCSFALASILAWADRRWLVSFAAFWLAMRSKEVGIVVPVLLLWYEMTLGKRNWKLTLPFIVPAAIYGVGGLIFNVRQQSAYTLHFNLATLARSTKFYFDKLLGVHWVGFGLLALPWLVRDRRVWFGTGALVLGLGVYLLLPGRLLEVYLYLAMAGAAVVIGALAARQPRVAALLVMGWVLWQFLMIRNHAKATLAAAVDRRAYFSAVAQVADAPIYIYDRIPASMHSWGVEGALRLSHAGIAQVHRLEDAGLPTEGRMLLLDWDGEARRLTSEAFDPAAATYIDAARATPAWQLANALHPARLYRPPNAVAFEWEACADGVEVHVVIGGKEVAKKVVRGCMTDGVPLQENASGITGVVFRMEPAGSAVKIGRFGFVAR